MGSIRVKKRNKKDVRRPCRFCGVKLSSRARYQHAKYRSCVRDKQPSATSHGNGHRYAIKLPEYSGEMSSDSDGSEETSNPVINDSNIADAVNRLYTESEQHMDQACQREDNDFTGTEDLSSTEEMSSSSSDEEAEEWNGVSPEDLLVDMENLTNTPIVGSNLSTAMTNQKAIVTWMLYFLLVWQTATLLSDNGLEWLLQFLSRFLYVIGMESRYVAGIASIFPGTLYMMRKFLGFDRDAFQRFVVCPRCTKLYKPDQCSTIINGRQVPLRCTHMVRHRRQFRECGHQLLREATLCDGKKVYYPLKTYCYNSIIETLERFVHRKGFVEQCEQWRERNVAEGEYGDVFDGKVWKNFMFYNDQPFLSLPRNYAFMMNCDWFQPYKRRSDFSVGAIYLVLMNLPREVRFKKENLFLVGIVPALSKEPASLNQFLAPLVDELKALWTGVSFITHASPLFPLKFRTALLCASSDLPAARKLCGFLSHAARLGCSRCFKEFLGGFSEKQDYSGFNRDEWVLRTNEEQRRRVARLDHATSRTGREKLESQLGVRYTTLLELEYYDAVRFCVIDGMHNLFLGTAKSVFKLWIEREILLPHQLSKLDDKISEMNVMTDVGRIPSKISSNYGSYTADEWKNWTMLYSIFCLKDVLPERDLKCWQAFVLACRALVKPYLTVNDIRKGDHLLMKFCVEFEDLYGNLAVKPNMHLHGHLKECILDYGPLYGFWAFSFERYNGLLGNFQTNNKNPEIQIMRKFFGSSFASSISPPDQYTEQFSSLLPQLNDEQYSMDGCRELFLASSSPITSVKWDDLSWVQLPERFVRATFDTEDLQEMRTVYSVLYPTLDLSACRLGLVIKKYGTVELGQIMYGSRMSCRNLRSARIRAAWVLSDGNINASTLDMRPGFVRYYFTHEIRINGCWTKHVFASMNWYKEHPSKDLYGNPVEVWQNIVLFGVRGASFMPVQRIAGKFAAAAKNILNIDSLVISPVPPKIFL